MRIQIMLVMLLLLAPSAWAATTTITSQNSGPWSLGSTWAGGVVPTSANDVVIAASTVVTVDDTAAQAKSVTVNYQGTLYFHRTADSTLTISAGDVLVNGTLDMGQEGDAITGTATLLLPSGPSAGRYGLGVEGTGKFFVRGADKSPYATAVDGSVLATQLTVPAAQAVGWAVGDKIVIGQTGLPSGSFAFQYEPRTISSVAGGVVQWSDGALTHSHTGSLIRVVNLTRNVKIISQGTNHSTNASFVYIGITVPGRVVLTQGEFSDLGANGEYVEGIHFNRGLDNAVLMSSCSVHDGYMGIKAGPVVSGGFIDNVVFGNVRQGVDFTECVLFQGNDVSGNGDDGIIGSQMDLKDNWTYGNAGEGLYGDFDRSSIDGNAVFANGGHGVYVSYGTDVDITNNLVSRNGYDGIILLDSTARARVKSNTLADNGAYNPYSPGIEMSQVSNIIVEENTLTGNQAAIYSYNSSLLTVSSNTAHDNNGCGLELNGVSNVWASQNHFYQNLCGITAYGSGNSSLRLVDNRIYLNTEEGLSFEGALNALVQDNWLGYDLSGAEAADNAAAGEVYPSNGSLVVSAVFRGNRVYAEPAQYGIITDGVDSAGDGLLVLNSGEEPGVARAWGNVVLSGDLTLDYAQPSFPSSAETPRVMRGSGHAATVDAVAAGAVSQVVAVEYEGGTWTVSGSSTGVLGTFSNGSPPSGATFSFGAVPQFDLSFSPGPSPADGDRVEFLTFAQASDAGVRKRMWVADPAYFPGRPKVSVAAGGSLTLRGSGVNTTTLDGDPSGTYFTFTSSGTLVLEDADVVRPAGRAYLEVKVLYGP